MTVACWVQALPVPPIYDMIISFIGAFLGILWVAGCAHALDNQLHENLLVASLGASAVLLYGVMESKLAQPRNVIGVGDISGIFVSAQVICLCCHLHSKVAELGSNHAREAEAALCYSSLHPCLAHQTLSGHQGCLALQMSAERELATSRQTLKSGVSTMAIDCVCPERRWACGIGCGWLCIQAGIEGCFVDSCPCLHGRCPASHAAYSNRASSRCTASIIHAIIKTALQLQRCSPANPHHQSALSPALSMCHYRAAVCYQGQLM